ncbi:MAG: hypothetical protein K2I45_02890 [Muribaculaceae bacterium]|nr:hypothetical protein [Muribaculaceae bacterium]
MVDVVIICIVVIAAGVAFCLQARHDMLATRKMLSHERFEQLKKESSESRTIDLIGEDAYHDMTARIERIIELHGHQACQTFALTCGPDTAEGSRELHRILPGCPLRLCMCREDGVDWIDVYCNGARIGRMALLDACEITDIMTTNHIRGAYVSEQNCYGVEDSHQIGIIIFYEPKEKRGLGADSGLTAEAGPENATHDFCPN